MIAVGAGLGLLAAHLAALPGDAPVDPDREEARRWILEELTDAQYRAAEPTWWDLLSQAFWDWLTSLDLSGAGFLQGPEKTQAPAPPPPGGRPPRPPPPGGGGGRAPPRRRATGPSRSRSSSAAWRGCSPSASS